MRLCGKLVSRLASVSLLIGASLGSEIVAAEAPQLDSDGWHTWRTAAAEHAPEWCCFAWNQGRKSAEGCDLDSERRGYGSSDQWLGRVDQVQLYVRTDGSRVAEIRALSPRCPVEADDGIADLGVIASADSLEWLSGFVAPQNELTGDALAAISVHAQSVPTLIGVIRDRDLDMDTREEALFWLAMNDSDDAMGFFEDLLL